MKICLAWALLPCRALESATAHSLPHRRPPSPAPRPPAPRARAIHSPRDLVRPPSWPRAGSWCRDQRSQGKSPSPLPESSHSPVPC